MFFLPLKPRFRAVELSYVRNESGSSPCLQVVLLTHDALKRTCTSGMLGIVGNGGLQIHPTLLNLHILEGIVLYHVTLVRGASKMATWKTVLTEQARSVPGVNSESQVLSYFSAESRATGNK